MVVQSDLARRRAAAKAARANQAPVVEDAVIQEPEPIVQPIKTSPPATANGKSNRSVALPVQAYDPARQLTERDIVMPKLKIAQGLSKVVQQRQVELNHWYHTTRNEDLGTEVLFVPVDMRKSRSYWVVGQGVMCRSFDMLQGEGTPGILCEGEEDEYYMPEKDRGCPLRLWTKDESTGKSKKPACGINYNYAGLVLLDGTPEGRVSRALLTLRGTASKTAKDINSLVSDLSMNPLEPDWSQSIIRLKLESKTNAYGTFGVPMFEYVGPTAEYPRLVEAAEAFRPTVNPNAYRATLETDQDDD